jgi:hypothetical protein
MYCSSRTVSKEAGELKSNTDTGAMGRNAEF